MFVRLICVLDAEGVCRFVLVSVCAVGDCTRVVRSNVDGKSVVEDVVVWWCKDGWKPVVVGVVCLVVGWFVIGSVVSCCGVTGFGVVILTVVVLWVLVVGAVVVCCMSDWGVVGLIVLVAVGLIRCLWIANIYVFSLYLFNKQNHCIW